MALDPRKPRRILIVHGVQLDMAHADQDKHIDQLVRSRLNGIPVEFHTELYRYENINDDAQTILSTAFGLLGKALNLQVPLASLITDVGQAAMDIIGDVVIALNNDSTAAKVRAGLRDAILKTYLEEQCALYLVGHSLGSVYALDVVNELMAQRPHGVFERNDRKTWPVQGLITLGSPLGLDMFSKGRALHELGAGRKWFRWFNYWARTDPVVSASFFGSPVLGYEIAERYLRGHENQGWIVHDRVVDMGHAWLFAHTAYWTHPPIGDDLVTFITS